LEHATKYLWCYDGSNQMYNWRLLASEADTCIASSLSSYMLFFYF